VKAAFFDLDRGLLRPRRPWHGWSRGLPDPRLELAARIRLGAPELLAAHRRQGHFTVLLTAGSAAWGQLAMQALAADGIVLAPEGSDPASAHWRCAAVSRFCARHDFAAAVSYGYGAQAEDWLWLETLGHPAVIHPVRDLRRLARTSAWAEFNLDGAPTGAPEGRAPPL
jgi:phosphoserine phosphatase